MEPLVILDVLEPLVAPTAMVGARLDSAIYLAPASEGVVEWLRRRTGFRVVGLEDHGVQARQHAVSELARAIAREMPLRYRDVELGPAAEYLIYLELVSSVRDSLVLAAAADHQRTGRSGQLVWMTDRADVDWLPPTLSQVLPRGSWQVVRRPGERYVDRLCRSFRLSGGRFAKALARRSIRGRPSAAYIVGNWPLFLEAEKLGREEGPGIVPFSEDVGSALAWCRVSRMPVILADWRRARRASIGHLERRASNGLADIFPEVKKSPYPLSYRVRQGLRRALESTAGPAVTAAAWMDCDCAPSPSGVVLLSDVLPHHRALVDAARRVSVPTVLYQHGVFALRTMHDRPRTDLIAVWGPDGEDWMRGNGVPAERIVQVGRLGESSTSHAGLAPSSRDTRPLRVLYASQPHVGFLLQDDLAISQRHLSAVYKACAASGCSLTAKPHPLESAVGWGMWVGDGKVSYRVVQDQPISKLLSDADLFVARSSTTILDALAARVPVILLAFDGDIDDNPFSRLGCLAIAHSPAELTSLLHSRPWPSRLPDSDAEDALDRCLGPRDGLSAARLLDLAVGGMQSGPGAFQESRS